MEGEGLGRRRCCHGKITWVDSQEEVWTPPGRPDTSLPVTGPRVEEAQGLHPSPLYASEL